MTKSTEVHGPLKNVQSINNTIGEEFELLTSPLHSCVLSTFHVKLINVKTNFNLIYAILFNLLCFLFQYPIEPVLTK